MRDSDGDIEVMGVPFCLSHGKPGGEDGGLDNHFASSEKIGGGVLDSTVLSDVNAASSVAIVFNVDSIFFFNVRRVACW